ncbi:VOC family protein [Ornithinimicrobium sp. INDO-MA30-4]|uniref:VOC family protein n=1 Tax=Ornithinimicrobium sp. INDO-MA30-4 TaxID=2908651 RepID=UPI0037C94B46
MVHRRAGRRGHLRADRHGRRSGRPLRAGDRRGALDDVRRVRLGWGSRPDPARGSAVSLHLTVTDVDATAARVVATGTSMARGPEDSPPAGRVAVFVDPFGHRWFLNQPAEN